STTGVSSGSSGSGSSSGSSYSSSGSSYSSSGSSYSSSGSSYSASGSSYSATYGRTGTQPVSASKSTAPGATKLSKAIAARPTNSTADRSRFPRIHPTTPTGRG